MLRGRTAERERLAQLTRDVHAGESRALVIIGEPGVGKSALLDHLVDRASGCGLARVAGVQAEVELAFGALHQLCSALLDRLDRLPEPQRVALGTTFGLRAGPAPDRLLLGLSVLSLVAEAASDRPLVCVIDDAQWLDVASAQVLGFVARRLAAESVAMVFARRNGARDLPLTGIPQMVLGGLEPKDARALLASVIPGPLDPPVRDRIVAETRGNPLAILELPRGLAPAELAGGFGLSSAGRLSRRIEDSFRRQLARLSPDQRRLALLAAAEPLGDPHVLAGAAERLRIPFEIPVGIAAGAPAEGPQSAAFEGLLEWGERVTFRHPLVRSAAYRSASAPERRAAHGALAEVTDPAVDADRRAWHRAQATAGPDEEVAAELERSAGRAQARGGFAAAAVFLERAATLTPAAAPRAARALAAAEAKHRAGGPDAALVLLGKAEAGPLDELQRARVDLLRAQVAYGRNRGDQAPPLLLRAARRLEHLDVRLARDTYLEALSAAQFAGGVVAGGVVAAAEAGRDAPAPAPATSARAHDVLLDGLVVLFTEGHAAGVPLLQRAVAMFRARDRSDEDVLRWNWLACRAASFLWDHDAWLELADRVVHVARDTGALSALPFGLGLQMSARILAGELDAVATLGEESDATAEATGTLRLPYGALLRSAWQGREAEARALVDGTLAGATARHEGLGVTMALMAQAILCNGLGHHGEALAAAERACEHPEDMALHNWSLVELVEAADRSRQHERAVDAAERLAERTHACGGDWAQGIEARCRALVSEGDDAERLHRDAIARLGRTRVRVDLARAHLLYGEWLRRERRRLDAREQLRRAHDMFTAMGAEAFAGRAGRELLATGETARRRAVDTGTQLTAREVQIAGLARDGLSNPEIGTRLFLSPRTVEYHLRKVFTKLDITSRTQLHAVLDSSS